MKNKIYFILIATSLFLPLSMLAIAPSFEVLGPNDTPYPTVPKDSVNVNISGDNRATITIKATDMSGVYYAKAIIKNNGVEVAQIALSPVSGLKDIFSGTTPNVLAPGRYELDIFAADRLLNGHTYGNMKTFSVMQEAIAIPWDAGVFAEKEWTGQKLADPYNASTSQSRLQFIILKKELDALKMPYGSRITGIYIRRSEMPKKPLESFAIRAKETKEDFFGANPQWEGGWTNLFGPLEMDQSSFKDLWQRYDFYQSLVWHGSKNIMFDISRAGGQAGGGSMKVSEGSCKNRLMAGYCDGCDLQNSSGSAGNAALSGDCPEIKLIVQPSENSQLTNIAAFSFKPNVIVAGSPAKLFAQLLYENNKPVANEIMAFRDLTENLDVGTGTTNANGVASVVYNTAPDAVDGIHFIGASFDGGSDFLPSAQTFKLPVANSTKTVELWQDLPDAYPWGYDYYNPGDPYASGFANARIQFVVPATQLKAAGVQALGKISSIWLKTSEAVQMSNFMVRAKATTQTVSTVFESGWQANAVFGPKSMVPADLPSGQWKRYVFNLPVEWDGMSNLMLDVSNEGAYDNDYKGAIYVRDASSLGGNMMFGGVCYRACGLSVSNNPDSYNSSAFVPALKISYANK